MGEKTVLAPNENTFGEKQSGGSVVDENIRLSCSRGSNLLNINEMNIHDRREDHVMK